MIVTIWRHGEAGNAIADRVRELTGNGADDVAFGCHQLHDACAVRDIPNPGLILHSGWVRTTQTAEIIASAFTHADRHRLTALQPGGTVSMADAALATLIDAREVTEHVVLVSHQPLVSYLVDHYLQDHGRVPSLSPGGLVTLELAVPARACGQLLFWALPPEYEAGL